MQIFADLHIHSKYSRATSEKMCLEELERFAKLKGLNLLGTGDCTHPLWLKELKDKLKEKNSGVFCFKDSAVGWVLTAEVSNVFEFEGKIKKVHNVLLLPDFEVAEQLNSVLAKYGDLAGDGRPTLQMHAAELVEICTQISKDIMIIPAHAWTPWFSLFGSKSGFDSIDDCFQDQTKNIFAIETGLSSDPAMNWRLSSLDRLALVSNSDCHSPYPWRLGREANVFELKELNYKNLINAIKEKNPKEFLYTIEVEPSYGKYHFDGHRNCKVCLEPKEAERYKNICPVCKRNLTIGVLHRVEALADREEGFAPKNAIPFKSLLPLYEIISYRLGINQLYSQRAIDMQNKLIVRFGTELNVLLNVKKEDLAKAVDEKIADAILLNRQGKIKISPGYDGIYGKPVFNNADNVKITTSPQKRIDVFLKK